MGDFTGFTFGDWHSSSPEVGDIVFRVSGGDRYEEQLQPEVKDRTAEVPGRDGEYYFGSDYGPRTIDIEIAFDHLKEEQFRRLRQVFGTKRIKELIFDERPYKKYMAKIESPVELSYVCFDEPKRDIGIQRNGVRVVNRNYTDVTASNITSCSPGLEVTLDEDIFQSLFTSDGDYEFIYRNSMWYYIEDGEESEVTLDNYGITVTLPETEAEEEIGFTVTNVTSTIVSSVDREQVTPYVYDYSKIERIYKGEGKISFKCYFPFAKSVFKQLPFTYQLTQDEDIIEGKKYFILENTIYSVVTEPNVADIGEYYERVVSKESEAWAISSGILSVDEYENIDKYNSQTGIINVYNAGDIETGFRLYLPGAQNSEVSLIYKENALEEGVVSLILKPFTLKDGDAGVLIDTVNELIVGVKSQTVTINGQEQQVGIAYDQNGNAIYQTSGNIYNEYIKIGHFFHLQPNIKTDGATLQIVNGAEGIEIFYDYLYF